MGRGEFDLRPTLYEARALIEEARAATELAWVLGQYASWWIGSATVLGFRIGALIRFRRWLS